MSKKLAASMAAVTALALVPVAVTAVSSSAAAAPHAQRITVHKSGPGTVSFARSSGETRAPSADDVTFLGTAVANRSPKSRAKVTRVTTGPSGVPATQALSVKDTSGATSWTGLTHYDQRTADGGNQWSLIPPDQALCVGNGQVVEAVNNAITVYSKAGAVLAPTTSINQLYWQDHEVLRPDIIASPHQMGDPSCVYDAGSDRFYMTVYDLVSDTAGNPTGPSAVDLLVSRSGNLADGFSKPYVITTTDAGGNGCPCFGDYPHLATDANGLYITTNEFSTLGDAFNGAQVYALDKAALAAGATDVNAFHFDTHNRDTSFGTPQDGYSLAPAVSAGTGYASNTMYFLSSNADVVDAGRSDRILVWTITGTDAISNPNAVLSITSAPVSTATYTAPPLSEQKAGSTPLADCLNITACAKALTGKPNRYKEFEYALDSNDARMLQSAYADGLLWGALDTAVDQGGSTRAGVAFFVVNPTTKALVKNETLAVDSANITYPALGVTAAGKAVMAVSLVGTGYFPSAAYVKLDGVPGSEPSRVTVVGTGMGPDDSFGGYRAYAYNHARWGDYGAAAVDGDTVWLASEFTASTCTLAQFTSTGFTCGGTRTTLANWATNVAGVSTG